MSATVAERATPAAPLSRRICVGLKRQSPLIAVLTVMALAAPAPGPGAAMYKKVQYPIMISLFVLTGMVIRLGELAKGAAALHVHALLQFFSLLFIPLTYYGLVYYWGWAEKLGILSHKLSVGTMAAMLMPTTTTTNILWTQMAEGDATIAAVNSVVGNLAGAFVAPMLATALLGSETAEQNFGATMWKMTWEIIFPMVGGMLLQYIWQKVSAESFQNAIPWLKRCLEIVMLVMTYGVFCGAFKEGAVGLGFSKICYMIVWIAMLHVFYLALAWLFSWRFCLRTRIAFAITASEKTENMAFAILQIIFGSSSGVFTLPVVTYHSIQMIVAAALVGPLRRRVEDSEASQSDRLVDEKV